jgi:predicted CoA-binding protein
MARLDFLVNDEARLRALLEATCTVAVVGLSENPARPSYGVAKILLDYGYEIYPVNPHESNVLGRPAVAELAQVPVKIDIVDLFRRSSEVGHHVDEAIAVGAKAVWLQDGVIDEAAALRAHEAGLVVVMDRCIARDLRRLREMSELVTPR